MDHCWQSYNAWIAHFDLLGFKSKLETSPIHFLQSEVDGIVNDLQAEVKDFPSNVDYVLYADTFILYSKSSESKDYPALLHTATHFMEKCIYKGIALRGSISYGEIAVGNDKRTMIGRAFLDSYQYCEDQDWLGLILSPTASGQLAEMQIDPIRHGFIHEEIPWRKRSITNREVFAYSFCRGRSNFPCPLLQKLEEMEQLAPEGAKLKYERTIRFIEKHWQIV